MTQIEIPEMEPLHHRERLKKAWRIILLLIFPVILFVSYNVIYYVDCVGQEPVIHSYGFPGGSWVEKCGYPLTYDYYYLYPWVPGPGRAGGHWGYGPASAWAPLITDVTVALVPIGIWVYIFRKLRPRS